MAGPFQSDSDLSKQLEQLHAKKARNRSAAASSLSEYFAFFVMPDGDVARKIIESLVDAFATETNRATRSDIFNALMTSAKSSAISNTSMDPIVRVLDNLPFNDLADALMILGCTQNVAYKEIVQRYIQHQKSTVKDAAIEALREMEVS